MSPNRDDKDLSLFHYLRSEFQRGYLLENDEERYTARREKFYAFFRIPWEIEKFITFGFLQCADSFFYVLTFLPIRFIILLWSLTMRSLKKLFRSTTSRPLLKPAEIVDLLKVFILLVCFYAVSFIDTSVYYHVIKTQSTIKLYLFFNMLEIADKLMSAFGQDTLDALFWTVNEPVVRKRRDFGLSATIFHLILTPFYVVLHSIIVLMQALTLNVALNSDNKGLLAILISNNFVELKGAVFKKFDRNNLLQIACSDVRERFHYCVLLFVVVIQTLKEYSWKEDRLFILLPDCVIIFLTEILIDWVKHAFITRFNDISITAYRDYNILIASDLIICKQKNAYTDHSDLVARRMGFIPLPLTVVVFRVLSQALTFKNQAAYVIFIFAFLSFFTARIVISIGILGKACDLVESVELPRSRNVSECVESSTPHIIRRRTVSKELKERFEPKNPPPPEPPKGSNIEMNLPSSSIPSASKDITSDDKEFKPLPINIKKEEVISTGIKSEKPLSPSVVPSIGFLGDSRSGLMTNSMVNISGVGFSQAIIDPDNEESGERVFNFSPQGGTKDDLLLEENSVAPLKLLSFSSIIEEDSKTHDDDVKEIIKEDLLLQPAKVEEIDLTGEQESPIQTPNLSASSGEHTEGLTKSVSSTF